MNHLVLSPFEKMKSRIAFGGDGYSDTASCAASTAAGAMAGWSGGTIGVATGAALGFAGNTDCLSAVGAAASGLFSASSPNDTFYNGMGDSGWTGGRTWGDSN